LTLTGHSDSVVSVSFYPDGRTLASGSRDGTIKLWDISYLYTREPLDQQIAEAQQKYCLELKDMELVPIPADRLPKGAKPLWSEQHPFHWLSKAESGDSNAMLRLGIIYDRDHETENARHWYTRAAEAGNTEAKERLGLLKQQ